MPALWNAAFASLRPVSAVPTILTGTILISPESRVRAAFVWTTELSAPAEETASLLLKLMSLRYSSFLSMEKVMYSPFLSMKKNARRLPLSIAPRPV